MIILNEIHPEQVKKFTLQIANRVKPAPEEENVYQMLYYIKTAMEEIVYPSAHFATVRDNISEYGTPREAASLFVMLPTRDVVYKITINFRQTMENTLAINAFKFSKGGTIEFNSLDALFTDYKNELQD